MIEALLDHLATYRAHRFAITKLDDGDFALFDPTGDLIAIGPLDELSPYILTGEAHYETCVHLWTSRRREPQSATAKALIEALGLVRPVKIERRI